ncbi:MAG TPA: hypothetical protein ENH88_16565 [Pseudoalteromonas prydzensis]|uniref:Uncharacterized protein n=2 Tax=Pseudoalteromonas prydzensis TaxID=182141 RepID=A0A7V1GFT4_9GAMM|nr:hypothetical protein [Pseudoalteromonas prydzensis]
MTGNGNGTVNIQIGNMSATADIGAPSSTSKHPNVNVDGNNVTRTTESPLDDFSPEELKGTNFNVLWGQDYSGEGGTERMFADYNYLSSIYDKVIADRTWGDKLFYGAFGDPNAPQLPLLEAGGVRALGLQVLWLRGGWAKDLRIRAYTLVSKVAKMSTSVLPVKL